MATSKKVPVVKKPVKVVPVPLTEEVDPSLKTLKEWFNTLPEPYRTQAIENIEEDLLSAKLGSLVESLRCGFLWDF